MNCRGYQNALVSGRSVDAAGDRHSATCPECRAFTRAFEEARAALAEPVAAERHRRPTPGFASRLAAELPARTGLGAWASLRLLPITAALAVTLLGWCLLTTPSPKEVWSHFASDDELAWVSSDEG